MREPNLAKIAKLRDLLKRLVGYELDEYGMTWDDIDGPCPKGLFSEGYWQTLKEVKEAV